MVRYNMSFSHSYSIQYYNISVDHLRLELNITYSRGNGRGGAITLGGGYRQMIVMTSSPGNSNRG